GCTSGWASRWRDGGGGASSWTAASLTSCTWPSCSGKRPSSVAVSPCSRSEAPMSQALAGRGGRVLGRSLLPPPNVITIAGPLAADWNDSHIFNDRWPSHARFHAVTALAMTTALSSANIWSLWSGGSGQARGRFFAAAVPVAYWAPFFLAPAVPG